MRINMPTVATPALTRCWPACLLALLITSIDCSFARHDTSKDLQQINVNEILSKLGGGGAVETTINVSARRTPLDAAPVNMARAYRWRDLGSGAARLKRSNADHTSTPPDMARATPPTRAPAEYATVTYNGLIGVNATDPYAISAESRPFVLPTESKILMCLFYGTLAFTAVASNAIVCYIVLSNQRMRTATNYFIVNLAVGDILMALLCIPFTFPANLIFQYWPFGLSLCVIVSYSQALSVFISAYTMVAISIDKYIAIMYPMRLRMPKNQAKLIILAIWSAALITSLPTALLSSLASAAPETSAVVPSITSTSLASDATTTSSTIDTRPPPNLDGTYLKDQQTVTPNSFEDHQLQSNNSTVKSSPSSSSATAATTTTTTKAEPTMASIEAAHSRARAQQASAQSQQDYEEQRKYFCQESWNFWPKGKYYYSMALMILQFVLPLFVLVITYTRIVLAVWGKRMPGEEDNARDARMARSKRKMIKMVIFCVIAFALTWLPFNALIVIGDIHQDVWEHQNIMYIWFTTHYLAMCHTITNPLIYIWMNNRFRAGFKQVIGDICLLAQQTVAFVVCYCLCCGCCFGCSRQKYARLTLDMKRSGCMGGQSSRAPLASSASLNPYNNQTTGAPSTSNTNAPQTSNARQHSGASRDWRKARSSAPEEAGASDALHDVRAGPLTPGRLSQVQGTGRRERISKFTLQPAGELDIAPCQTTTSEQLREELTVSESRAPSTRHKHLFRRIVLPCHGGPHASSNSPPVGVDLAQSTRDYIQLAKRKRKRGDTHAISLQMTTSEFYSTQPKEQQVHRCKSTANKWPIRVARRKSSARSRECPACKRAGSRRTSRGAFHVDLRQSSQSTATISAQTNYTSLAVSPINSPSRSNRRDNSNTSASLSAAGSAGDQYVAASERAPLDMHSDVPNASSCAPTDDDHAPASVPHNCRQGGGASTRVNTSVGAELEAVHVKQDESNGTSSGATSLEGHQSAASLHSSASFSEQNNLLANNGICNSHGDQGEQQALDERMHKSARVELRFCEKHSLQRASLASHLNAMSDGSSESGTETAATTDDDVCDMLLSGRPATRRRLRRNRATVDGKLAGAKSRSACELVSEHLLLAERRRSGKAARLLVRDRGRAVLKLPAGYRDTTDVQVADLDDNENDDDDDDEHSDMSEDDEARELVAEYGDKEAAGSVHLCELVRRPPASAQLLNKLFRSTGDEMNCSWERQLSVAAARGVQQARQECVKSHAETDFCESAPRIALGNAQQRCRPSNWTTLITTSHGRTSERHDDHFYHRPLI